MALPSVVVVARPLIHGLNVTGGGKEGQGIVSEDRHRARSGFLDKK
jgi:hypothetical protein